MTRRHRITPSFRYPVEPIHRRTFNAVPWLVRCSLLAGMLVLTRLLGVSP